MSAPSRKPGMTDGEAMQLMRKMGARYFDPMPPGQHAAMNDPDQPPRNRMWSVMCASTIDIGRHKEYAVNKEGQPLNLDNLAEILGMDPGNARRTWREGVERGLWRNGTKAEGETRLYFNGAVPKFKPPEPLPGGVRTDPPYSPYLMSQINNLPDESRQSFTKRAAALVLRDKWAFAEWVAAFREVVAKDQDTLFLEFGINKIRDGAKTREDADPAEVEARQRRIAKLAPVAQQFVLTFELSEQTAEPGSYEAEKAAVQSRNGGASLLRDLTPRKEPDFSGRISPTVPASGPDSPLPVNGESPFNQLPADAQARSREARTLAAKEALRKKREKAAREKATEPKPPAETPAETEAIAMLFENLERMQTAYTYTDFSYDKVSPDNGGDRATVKQIVRAVNLDVIGFTLHVAAQFKGLNRNALGKLPGRPPGSARGPRSLGLLLEWAKDYALRTGGRAPIGTLAEQSDEAIVLNQSRHTTEVFQAAQDRVNARAMLAKPGDWTPDELSWARRILAQAEKGVGR